MKLTLLAAPLVLALACESDTRRAYQAGDGARHTPSPERAVRVVLVPNLEGVLEPCGCTGIESGGVDRLAHAVQELRETGASTLLLAVGNIFGSARGEPAQKAQADLSQAALVAALKYIGVDGVVPEPEDVLSRAPLIAELDAHGISVVAAEGGRYAGTALLAAAGMRLGVVNLLAEKVPERERLVASLRERGAQRVIAIGARRPDYPEGVDVFLDVGASGPFIRHDPGQVVCGGGRRGNGFWVLAWPDASEAGRGSGSQPPTGGGQEVKAEFIALDERSPRDSVLRGMLDRLFSEIAAQNRSQMLAAPAPRRNKATYVGAKTCAACHTEAYYWWAGTRHGRAYDSLVARSRQLDLDCVTCHSTGFGRPGGASLSHLEGLEGVGCESCHGPGSLHVEDPRPPHRPPEITATRACTGCHDEQHREGFDEQAALSSLIAPGHGR